MGLDIREPLGLMFAIIGALMVVFGFMTSPEIYQRSLGINVNVDWGFVLLVFGIIMYLLGRTGTKAAKDLPAAPESDAPVRGH
ncbi:MAG: hypothetical protein ACYCW6_27360 [Candidatus Xenobia bacterium]